MSKNESIEFNSDDCMPIVSACLSAALDLFDNPMSTKDILMIMESLEMVSELMKKELQKKGVTIGSREAYVKDRQ